MTWLLDTVVLSELRRASRADERVVQWFNAQEPTSCAISAMTVFELELGVLRKERSDPTQGAILRTWLDGRVRAEFADRILPVDEVVATRAAALHVPDPKPERDALIAATASVHGLTIVTRNIRDFAGLGVAALNPWTD